MDDVATASNFNDFEHEDEHIMDDMATASNVNANFSDGLRTTPFYLSSLKYPDSDYEDADELKR